MKNKMRPFLKIAFFDIVLGQFGEKNRLLCSKSDFFKVPFNISGKIMWKSLLICIISLALFESCAKKPVEVWYCPMHKFYQANKPGNCPICGMQLVKKEDATSNKVEVDHTKHDKPADAPEESREGTAVSKRAKEKNSFSVTKEMQKDLGIFTQRPQVRTLGMKLRIPAQVAYEPDIYTALVEYRQLLGQSASMSEGISSAGFLNSAKLRIRQLGLSDDEIHQYAHSELSLSRLLVGSAGGKALVSLQIPEGDTGLVKKGQTVVITSNTSQDKKYTGRVIGVATLVDSKLRVVLARALVTDSKSELKAQMFVSAEIAVGSQKGLSIPRTAVYNTGVRQLVFVKNGESEFTPVEIKVTGGNEEFVVITGIGESDDVVVSSGFLLDSEARIRLEQYR